MVENLFHMDGLVTLQACLKAKINLSRFFTFDDVIKWYEHKFHGLYSFNIKLNILEKDILIFLFLDVFFDFSKIVVFEETYS